VDEALGMVAIMLAGNERHLSAIHRANSGHTSGNRRFDEQ
jgi:hypothetical protein